MTVLIFTFACVKVLFVYTQLIISTLLILLL